MKKEFYLALGFTVLLVVSSIPLAVLGVQVLNFVFSKI